ncbi:MAG TPA: hypothetical protein ENK18_24800 [Deltaproteobacteria bacterium]|nr:hypothetical protein [Deltaproteobacteria bacterium]
MEQAITLDDVRRAWEARDPGLADLMVALAISIEPQAAVRSDALTWEKIKLRHQGYAFQRLDLEERRQQRIADWKALEADDAEVPLPDRLWLHRILLELWSEGSPWARHQLTKSVAALPLRYGPWRGMKRIFKEAEERQDWEIYGALAARFDSECANYKLQGDIRRVTLRYLVRRAWRRLRALGSRLPSVYPDAAAEFLRHYGERVQFRRTWIANHIFFHELPRAYSRSSFVKTQYSRGVPALQYRAYADAWRRTPRPLFALLEGAQAETVRAFAAEALKTDFRTQLREVEPSWVVRLVGVHSASVDRFVVWILENVPRFEPGAFRELGLHGAVLSLLDSDATEAAAWAAQYARIHGRDLPLSRLIVLANSGHTEVRKLVRDLLRDRDPRGDVGLEAWGQLLGTRYGHELAVEALQEHFGARELTLDWFRERLLSGHRHVVSFATSLLPKIHPDRQVPTSFYTDLLDHPEVDRAAAGVALSALSSRDLSEVDVDVLRRALLNRVSRHRIQAWIREGKLTGSELGVGFVKTLAFHPSWDTDPWIEALRSSDRTWARGMEFDEGLSDWALGLLGDPRIFTADDIGFAWLFEMVQRSEPRYHDFAVNTLTRSFKPGDFADEEDPHSDAMAGAERLWEMAIGKGQADDPLRRFALHYLRMHHPEIHLDETERALEAGAELPAEFLTLERAEILVADDRTVVRRLGLAWMRYELARWDPPLARLVALSELPHSEVRELIELALTAEDKREHRRYRLDPDRLTPDGVYRFCESLDAGTRALGMKLIVLHQRLAVPEELFRLTESPDRRVRAFVVRQLWARYRHRATSPGWAPTLGEGEEAAPGRPESWPAPQSDIRAFLRYTLFGIPPARPPKKGTTSGLRPLPARQAKLALIDVCRDFALEDHAFAQRVTPMLQEFLHSRGRAESAACLVALTRIAHRWGDAGGLPTPASEAQ